MHKTCDVKPIARDFIENLVIDALKKNVFTPSGINAIVDAIKQYTATKHVNSGRIIEELGKEYREIEKKLHGFMKAIADGLYSPMMKSLIEHLKLRKEKVAAEITNQKRAAAAEFSEAMIREFLEHDAMALERKTPEDLKRIIRCYVEQVAVTAATVTVVTFVVFYYQKRYLLIIAVDPNSYFAKIKNLHIRVTLSAIHVASRKIVYPNSRAEKQFYHSQSEKIRSHEAPADHAIP